MKPDHVPTKLKLLYAVTALVVISGAVLALSTPPEAVQRTYARILHLHVPSAWLAFLAFGVTALGSVMWRLRRRFVWDRLAASSAEIGVLFTGLAIATGAIWGRPVWGVFFDWGDARMASTAVMFLVYLGYLALRRYSPSPELAADRASILGIVAVIQVPLVYFSVNLFRTLHQTQSIRPDGSTLEASMVTALLVNLAAFTLLYVSFLAARMIVAREEARLVAALPVAGAAVISPPGLSDA
ncbi:MAG TPA: cytochrome c biogenesis protein [Acidimicrobiia bacterium]|nr:cytochrome c biogenesis protein [Acidimicrobiia bacterium]